MNSYRPKQLFQTDSKAREQWAQVASSSLLKNAIAYAQADMAFAGFGPAHMDGVNFFIIGLLNLSESEDPQKPLPIRTLKSWDEPLPVMPPEEQK